MASLAHWSDLHLGASPAHERRLARAVEQCLAQRVDHVVVTGDLTDGGLERELATFDRLVAPLRAQGRVTVIPGNHDRCGDDVSPQLCDGRRVSVANPPGLHLVRVDTTAPHNAPFASYWSHGDLCQQTLEAIDQALDAAPPGTLVALLLHHHVTRLPVESVGEWLAVTCGFPNADELKLGVELLRRIRGRADLVLHGHRHVPRQFVADARSHRPLRVFNAGSLPALGAFRVFHHVGGALIDAPVWNHLDAGTRERRYTRPTPPLALQLA